MDDLTLSENAEEILAHLWVAAEQQSPPEQAAEISREGWDAALAELTAAGLTEQGAGAVSLTDSGKAEGASIVRRERLAERLLTDVLELAEGEMEETACKFEHLLRRGLDDEICTLLGHPRFCPHGSPIPPGECCRARARAPAKVISALADLPPGQSGVVAYVHGRRQELMQRMLAMGVIPGAPIALVQTAPSYVFQLGHGLVAVDRETAQDIYVRITERPSPVARKAGWLPGRFRRLGLGPRRRGR